MQGFNIRANDKGSVIYHNDKPLVICKGLFYKLVDYNFKIEGASKEMLKELTKIAYIAHTEKHGIRWVIDNIEKLGENHCFRIHRGFVYDSILLFEQGLNEL